MQVVQRFRTFPFVAWQEQKHYGLNELASFETYKSLLLLHTWANVRGEVAALCGAGLGNAGTLRFVALLYI